MGAPLPKHIPEFKQRVVELYRSKQPMTYPAVASEPGVDPGSLSDWVKRSDAAADGPDPSANPLQMAEDPKRPRRENERLRMENGMLSEVSAFLTGHQL